MPELENRVTILESENVLLRKLLDDIVNPEPSRESDLSGACRDLTGDTLPGNAEGEEKVHSFGKPEGECSKCGNWHNCLRNHRQHDYQRQSDGAPIEQSVGKLRVKRGSLLPLISLTSGDGNPVPSLSKGINCRQEGVETRDEKPNQ
jgi:hypothetical protein